MRGEKKKAPKRELKDDVTDAMKAGMSYGKYKAAEYLKAQLEKVKKDEKAKMEREIENIKIACAMSGLDDHITFFTNEMPATTEAQTIAAGILKKKRFAAKTSFVYCDDLEMCFFYDRNGIAMVSYAGAAKAGSEDIKHNLTHAFNTAAQVLEKMQELSDHDKEARKKA